MIKHQYNYNIVYYVRIYMRGWWRWALVSPDGVASSRMVGVSASVNLPLHHKVQKFFSGTDSPSEPVPSLNNAYKHMIIAIIIITITVYSKTKGHHTVSCAFTDVD